MKTMKERILDAIGNEYYHLLPSIMSRCFDDFDDINEVESFIVALTELVQDGVVVYSKPVGDRKYGKYNIK